ncbi:MAG: hypothetical protein EXS11_07435 [Gemmataceae bacterium]|nr:hypothetical protein [Gemmataceae bacterium]
MISLCSLLYLLAGQRDLSVEVTLNGLGKGLTSAQLLERPLSGNAVFHSQWKKGLSGQVLENDKNIGSFQVFAGSLSGKAQDWVALFTQAPRGNKVSFHPSATKMASPFVFDGDWKSLRKLSDKMGPIIAVFCEPYDPSTPASKEATFKTFTHVYDPEGDTLISKGAGGKFPHHRGLFYGFMKTTYSAGVVDTWHCKDGVHLNLTGPGVEEVGPLAARVTLPVGWYGKKDDLFAMEERQFTAIRAGKALVVDFASRVTPVQGTIKVDGDPQHAGFHFRAADEVASKTSKETVFVRPSGTDAPGATRNWPERKDHINLAWNSMQFSANGNRYSATYINHPRNPGESRFSEREYGRFGCYFVTDATIEKPLVVQYRTVFRRGPLDQEDAQADAVGFSGNVK